MSCFKVNDKKVHRPRTLVLILKLERYTLHSIFLDFIPFVTFNNKATPWIAESTRKYILNERRLYRSVILIGKI